MPARFRHAFQLREFLYPANLLTLARLLMLPAAIRYMAQPDGRWRALGVFGVAMAIWLYRRPSRDHPPK